MAFDITQVETVYDSLTSKVKADLDEQFNNGRLKGSDYANVYAQLMQQCIQLAFQAPINEAQIQSINKDLELKEAQIYEINSRKSLIDAQKDDQEYVTTYIRPTEKELNISKNAEINKQIVLIQKQEDEISQRITSMQIEDTIKQEQSNKDLELKEAQIDEINSKIVIENNQSTKDLEIKEQQRLLYQRQRQGFDDNLKQKMLEIQLNAWSMMFSSGMLSTSPSIITNDEASTLYNNLKTQLGI